MNKFNWSALKNNSRLTPAQKKTVEKILVSLQVPARNKYRNRPPLNFNIGQFRKQNGTYNIAKINSKVRLPPTPKTNNNNRPLARPPANSRNNLATQMYRQHREAYGE